MKKWALIAGGTILACVEQDEAPTIPGVWVECTGQYVGPGSTWNGSAFGPVPPPVYPSLTKRAFWCRFSVTEREALQGMLATGTQGQKNKLNAFRDYVQTGMRVELTDDYIIASVTLMESVGLIAAGRASAILTAPISANEANGG